MARFISAVIMAGFALGLASSARAADDKDAKAILDKAIKAMGGEEKLEKVKGYTAKAKGKITLGDTDNEFTSETTVQGIDHFRNEFEGEFGGNKVKGVIILAGDKGWRQFGDDKMDMDKEAVANEKRNAYLQGVPVTLLPLKDKAFKIESAKEEKVDGKPADALKVTGPDGKDFTLYFDKESNLPVKLTAKVAGFMGDEAVQDTTFSDYKEVGGIKKAMKIQTKRGGEKFLEQQISDFKVLDKVDANTFTEPK
jgi:outer membrane lipoprotein-sorting protein